MVKRNFILDLGKLVVAAAWADGEIQPEELNSLKDLLFQLPELTGEEWAELQIYIASPVSPAERDRLLGLVLDGIRSSKERQLVIRTLTKLVEADGKVTAEEASLLDEVKSAVEGKDSGLLSRLGKMIGGSIRKRGMASRNGPNREVHIDDYLRNTVYFQARTEMEKRGLRFDIPEPQVRKLCLAAGIMARVAWVDREISETEKTAIREELRKQWNLDGAEADLVSEMSCSRVIKGLDHFRLGRSFFEATTPGERKRFLKCLFHIANANQKISHPEIIEIRKIADSLKIPHSDFIEEKLQIPRSDRGGL